MMLVELEAKRDGAAKGPETGVRLDRATWLEAVALVAVEPAAPGIGTTRFPGSDLPPSPKATRVVFEGSNPIQPRPRDRPESWSGLADGRVSSSIFASGRR
ncbi:MAG: hypothetical protein CMJ51_04595 [Planctomycetaceae bacterium]|nr:hypothetical protein [Planctomycetaceae bacterium]